MFDVVCVYSKPSAGRGMKLGKPKDVDTFVNQLKSEGQGKNLGNINVTCMQGIWKQKSFVLLNVAIVHKDLLASIF